MGVFDIRYTNFQKVHVIQITSPNCFSWFFEVEMLTLESALGQQFCWLTSRPSVVPKKINTDGMSCGPKRIRWSWSSFETIDGHLVRYATPVSISQQTPTRNPRLSMEWYIVFTNYGSLPFLIILYPHLSLNRSKSPWNDASFPLSSRVLLCGHLAFFGACSPSIRHVVSSVYRMILASLHGDSMI